MRSPRRRFPAALALCLAAVAVGAVEPSPPSRTRVFLIGIDGATWKVMLPLLRAGRLPNLMHLIVGGSSGPLLCNVSLFSPNIWTTIATGKTPRQHGIDDHTFHERPFSSRSRRVRALWNILSDKGRTVDLVGYLVTWPAETVRGVVVSDQALVPGLEEVVYPADALASYGPLPAWDFRSAESSRRIGRFVEYPFKPGQMGNLVASPPDPRYQELISNRLAKIHLRDESWVRIAEFLLARDHPDFFAIHLWGVDSVSHGFWKFGNPKRLDVSSEERRYFGETVAKYYEYADEAVGRLLRFADDDTQVFVVSDHGFKAGYEPSTIDNADPNSGDHEEHGVIIARGSRIRSGGLIDQATVLDIAPTLLAMFGLPVAKDMPGKILEPLFHPEDLQHLPTRRIPTYESPSVAAPPPARGPLLPRMERDRLRAIGYLK